MHNSAPKSPKGDLRRYDELNSVGNRIELFSTLKI